LASSPNEKVVVVPLPNATVVGAAPPSGRTGLPNVGAGVPKKEGLGQSGSDGIGVALGMGSVVTVALDPNTNGFDVVTSEAEGATFVEFTSAFSRTGDNGDFWSAVDISITVSADLLSMPAAASPGPSLAGVDSVFSFFADSCFSASNFLANAAAFFLFILSINQ
jgi:hypothetical protein